MSEITQQIPVYSHVLVALMKGPIYQSDNSNWRLLLLHQKEIKKYFNQMAVRLYINEIEGFGFLKPLTSEEKEAYKEETGFEVPVLMSQRKLSFSLTLLMVLLRKRLLELDAQSGETRLIISREQIKDMLVIFLPDGNNQAKLVDSIDTNINKLLEIGILRKLQQNSENFEVNRIIKAKITPVELEAILAKLELYCAEEEVVG